MITEGAMATTKLKLKPIRIEIKQNNSYQDL